MDLDTTERVLTKLGLGQRPEPTLEGLTTLYDAWCRRVPFDNVRKLIHVRDADPSVLPGDTPDDFFDAWLRHGCGGTCWAGNGALHALLETLGFDTRRMVATMLVVPDLPPNHGSVTVRLDGADYMVDASILHREPLPMVPDAAASIDHAAWGVEGRWVDGRFHVRWRNFLTGASWLDCAVNSIGADAPEFSERHEATRGWSPFNYSLSLNLVRDRGRIGAGMGKLSRLDEAGALEERTIDLDGRRRFLIDEVGMSEELVARLPDDVPMPPPPAG